MLNGSDARVYRVALKDRSEIVMIGSDQGLFERPVPVLGFRIAVAERYEFVIDFSRFPIGTRVRVTNLANGRSVVVRVNDRGPFAPGRVIDVSRAAAQVLGMIERGTTRVHIESLGEGPPGTVTDRARKSRRRGGRTRRAPQG